MNAWRQKETKEEQELGIGSKTQESRGLCDAFRLFGNCAECFFLLFWNTEEGRKALICGDR